MGRKSLKNFEPFPGFEDRFGHDTHLELFLENKLFELFRLFGYKQIDVPILEKKDLFSSKYVGESPWPGWDERCLFEVNIIDYAKDYRRTKKSENGVLVPEGTVSVCRWVANQIIKEKESVKQLLPLKLYYSISCFRNEPIPDLSQTKGREFKQVGLELLGPSGETADVEVLYLIARGLEAVGVPRNRINIRIGDIRVFNHLIDCCNIKKEHEVTLKEKLDKLAEYRALAARNEAIQLQNETRLYLKKIGVSTSGVELWEKLFSLKDSDLKEISAVVAKDFKSKKAASSLRTIGEMLNFLKVPFKIDLCVVRGQEYYTGPVFEVDVRGRKAIYLEVAGGGRYDQLISRFLKPADISVPGTGFAFGLERIRNVVKNEELKDFKPEVKYFLDETDVDYVIFPKNMEKSWKTAEAMRKEWKRVDLYLLDKNKRTAKGYAKRKGANFLEI